MQLKCAILFLKVEDRLFLAQKSAIILIRQTDLSKYVDLSTIIMASLAAVPSKSYTARDTRTRSYILASFWLVVIFSLPYWWISTSIQRLPLPSLDHRLSQDLRVSERTQHTLL